VGKCRQQLRQCGWYASGAVANMDVSCTLVLALSHLRCCA
jgi:hypothetical protein